jgi:hypothetical protein
MVGTRKYVLILGSYAVFALLLSACRAAATQEPSAGDIAADQAAATLAVELTQSVQGMWTATPEPESLIPATRTPTPDFTPTAGAASPTAPRLPQTGAASPTPTSRPPSAASPTPGALSPTRTPADNPTLTPLTTAAPAQASTQTPTQAPTRTSLPTALPTRTPAPTTLPTQPPSPTPIPTLAPPPTPTPFIPPQGQVLIEEDFSATRAWAEQVEDSFRLYYAENGYRIQNSYTSVQVASVRSFNPKDPYIETSGRLSAGEQSAYFGPVCRWSSASSFYGFGISGNGGYAIYRVQNGQVTFLDQGSDDQGRIRPAGEINRIAAYCDGDQLSLIVNDHLLLEIRDSAHSTGQVGLAVLTQGGAAEAHFTNYLLVQP